MKNTTKYAICVTGCGAMIAYTAPQIVPQFAFSVLAVVGVLAWLETALGDLEDTEKTGS
ncbi:MULTISPECIES: hypothetical protein [Natrialbaceae]|uniref:hypothetical protein n=1 Tax=Natrialbaceae TaxID=1644061 RepID=UPI00207CABE0|nr:hypothetical protein [Natronococcus sp. CG52]